MTLLVPQRDDGVDVGCADRGVEPEEHPHRTGDADGERYQAATEIILADTAVDGLLALLTPQAATDPTTCAERAGDGSRPLLNVDDPAFMYFEYVSTTRPEPPCLLIDDYQDRCGDLPVGSLTGE